MEIKSTSASIQLLVTIAVAATVVKVPPIYVFFTITGLGFALYMLLIFTPLIGKFRSQSHHSLFVLSRTSFPLSQFSTVLSQFCVMVSNREFLVSQYLRGCNYVSVVLLSPETSCELSLTFVVGLTCVFTSGKVILESVILAYVVVVSLTLYTLGAAKRGHEFNFIGPFLFGAIIVLMVFSFIQERSQ